MKNTMKKSLSVAMGATFAAAMTASPVVSADANPFGMQNLESGYMQVAEGKCGEGKCGESKMKKEGKCGGATTKEAKSDEGKMGKEGKCGEGKMEAEEEMEKEAE